MGKLMKCKKCNIDMKNFNPNCHTMLKCNNCGEISGDNCLGNCLDCGGTLKYSSDFSSVLCKKCGKIISSNIFKQQEGVVQKEKIDTPSFPSVTQMGKNLASSVFDYAKSGFKNTDDEKYEKRLEVCGGCESFEHSSSRCRECGCFMEIKAKMESAKCPLGKWKN